MEQTPILYLMLGYPGAGKTTTAHAISEETGAIHLQSDKFRVAMFAEPTFSQEEHNCLYGTLDYVAELLLGRGVSVIYDANLNRFQHRQEKYDICSRTGAKPILLWVKTPKDMAKERAVHDSRQHLVPPNESAEDMFERIADVIEPPLEQETPVSIDGTNVTSEYIKQLLSGLNISK